MSPGINKNTMLQWKIIWSILFLLIFNTNVWAIGEITFEMGVAELSKQLVEGLGEEKIHLYIEPFTEELTGQPFPLSILLQNAVSESLKGSKQIVEGYDASGQEVLFLRGRCKVHGEKILISAEIFDQNGTKISKAKAIIEKNFVDEDYFVAKLEDYFKWLASKINGDIMSLGTGYMDSTFVLTLFPFNEKTELPISRHIPSGLSDYLNVSIVRKDSAFGFLSGEIIDYGSRLQVVARLNENESKKLIVSAKVEIPKDLIPESWFQGKKSKPSPVKKISVTHSYRADEDEIGLIETMKENALRAARRKLLKKMISKPYRMTKDKGIELLDQADEDWISEEDKGVKLKLSIDMNGIQ